MIKTLPFEKPDGDPRFQDFSGINTATWYATLTRELLDTITTTRLTQTFGKKGEIRPQEYTDGYLIWRFQYNNTILRIQTPIKGKAIATSIWVEEPATAEETSTNHSKRCEDVTNFIKELMDRIK